MRAQNPIESTAGRHLLDERCRPCCATCGQLIEAGVVVAGGRRYCSVECAAAATRDTHPPAAKPHPTSKEVMQ